MLNSLELWNLFSLFYHQMLWAECLYPPQIRMLKANVQHDGIRR